MYRVCAFSHILMMVFTVVFYIVVMSMVFKLWWRFMPCILYTMCLGHVHDDLILVRHLRCDVDVTFVVNMWFETVPVKVLHSLQ